MTKEEAISSITDKDWASKNELGTIEEIIEYSSGEEIKQVKVVAHILSGAESDAIDSKYSSFNTETNKLDVDSDGMTKAKMCKVFRIDSDTYDLIMNNKSSDLRLKMMMLMNRVSGASNTVEDIDKEKNSESPEA